MRIQNSFEPTDKGTLFLVPTPIGNLDDMTFRAVKTLQAVDLIAAEDTRNTGKLLAHFGIKTPQISFHEHNTQQRLPELIAKMTAGVSIAQVSDAGLPSISDPGQELVQAAIAAEIAVVPLPGASAGITALIASGLVPQPFYFYGFLPRKKKELKIALARLVQRQETMILYESPHHLRRTLADLATVFASDQAIVLGRELTKLHESFERGTLAELQAWYSEHEPRGEYVLLLAAMPELPRQGSGPLSTADLKAAVEGLIAGGQKPNQAIKQVAQEQGLSRQTVYQRYHDLTQAVDD
ncbi:16S rRNA (cytidine(1402)-2'-O)-methyltransferase [Lapidilactobacillus luobeiensis]|uniref:16S rRNA (cytidine(1402)-2'-O)-methyltransferase n=1 Tax=Lapidilactobacillus luobeiensis TaxID=2950371 RepID=UPI0021C387ED|nr:16S rRNA (cytidine(1402)-2'-O)-methyltransferase [Lapidilactobacillus luobeiensis]